MKIRTLLALTGLCALASGCTNLTSPARKHTLEASQQYWFDYDVTRRGAIMVPSSTKIKMCAEPSPDAGLTLLSKMTASVQHQQSGVGGEVSGEFNASLVKLAERTQMVMFLREALYRLCEQSLNNDFKEKDILNAYSKVIDAALKMADQDQQEARKAVAKAKEAEAKADTTRIKAKVEAARALK